MRNKLQRESNCYIVSKKGATSIQSEFKKVWRGAIVAAVAAGAKAISEIGDDK